MKHSSKGVAVVTGATRGIGRAIQAHLGVLGLTAYGCGRTSDDDLLLRRLDIRDSGMVREWREEIACRHGHIDLLVNNAAILGARASFKSIAEEAWREVIDTNILGTITVTREFLSLLAAAGGCATIINIGSILGRFGRAGWSTYAVSKFALQGLTEVLAQELAKDSVRVVCVHPPRVSTELRRHAYPDEPMEDEGVGPLLTAIEKILNNPRWPVSGMTLSASDVDYWSP